MARHSEEQWRGPRWGLISLVIVVVLACIGGGLYAGSVLMSTAAKVPPTENLISTPPATPTTPAPAPTSDAVPASPAAMPCATQTTMSIMAHYDDDLLFANPALLQAVRADDCVRTVFVTAGDAGKGPQYYKDRETGILRAYNSMRGALGALWDERKITLDSGLQITTLTPGDGDNISVTFLRLPDGGLTHDPAGGLAPTGFASTGGTALPWLLSGQNASMSQLDTGVSVSLDMLRASLVELITAYAPTNIYTLVPKDSSWSADDHPDHSAVGVLARDAAAAAGIPESAMHYAVGYHTGSMDQNLSGEELQAKSDAFAQYAQMDPVSYCDSLDSCSRLRTFGRSLTREYLLNSEEIKQ